jgi:hypothetical protein
VTYTSIFRRPLWQSSWPFLMLVLFGSLAAIRLLHEDYIRAALSAPILLMVPGSLTLGVLFSKDSRPQGVTFVCFAALLGAIWSAFASLILYVGGVSITADSTYWCLLVISTVLAVGAEARMLFEHPGKGRRVANKSQFVDPDWSDETDDAKAPTAAKGAGYYAVLAVVAGVSLIAGALYTYDHIPHPAPVGYTYMAWTGQQIRGDIAVGPAGTDLRFEIVHRESDATDFRLIATWFGSPSQAMAKPVSFTIGPDRTFHGTLFVPPLPNGCTYRIVVALTAPGHIDPLTRSRQTWSINVDVRDPNKPIKNCK